MPFRDAIARLALSDARRFEVQTVSMLNEILESCPDDATRQLVRDLIQEEESHIRALEQTLPSVKPSPVSAPPEEKKKIPPLPDTSHTAGSVCQRLADVLKKEEASVTFYSLLAERTLIPAVRDVFRGIADGERGHARKLAEHIRRVCGPCERQE